MPRLKRWVRERLPDRYERALLYYEVYGRLPLVAGAALWSEKLNVRVLFDRRPIIAMAADKLATREYVAKVLPTLRMAGLVWSGTDVAELEGLPLPEAWVLKPNHRSGDVYFGHGPVTDVASLRKATLGWLEEMRYCREWSYSQARRLLMIETRIGRPGEPPPDDYKFFAFDGKVAFVQHHRSRFAGHATRNYSVEWQPLEVTDTFPLAPVAPPPAALEEMIAAAQVLSQGYDFVRVDLYDDAGTAYFGELTAYPASGLEPFCPATFDAELGADWALPPEVRKRAEAHPVLERGRRAFERALVGARGARQPNHNCLG